MAELIQFTKTLTLPEPAPARPQLRMAVMAVDSEPEQKPSIWALQAQAVAELLAELQAAGLAANESWIRSSIHRVGSTVDTVRCVGILPPGAPARFTGGPLDGQTMPSEMEPTVGQVPRLTRADGSYYELAAIDYSAGEYVFSFHPLESLGFEWQ